MQSSISYYGDVSVKLKKTKESDLSYYVLEDFIKGKVDKLLDVNKEVIHGMLADLKKDVNHNLLSIKRSIADLEKTVQEVMNGIAVIKIKYRNPVVLAEKEPIEPLCDTEDSDDIDLPVIKPAKAKKKKKSRSYKKPIMC